MIKKKNFQHIIGVAAILMIAIRYYFSYPYTVDTKDYYQWARCINLGMIPYKDFNMLQTPLSVYVNALFYKINSSIFFVHIIPLTVSVLVTAFFSAKLIMYRNPNSRIFSVYLWAIVSILVCSALYNTMSLMFWIIGLYVYTTYKQYNDVHKLVLIGFFAGLCFFTKQNIAAFMIASLGVIFVMKWIKEKAETKKIIKEFLLLWLSFAFVLALGMLFFWQQGCLNEFFEYTLFPANDFISPYIKGTDDLVASIGFVIITILATIYVGYISKETELCISGVFAAFASFPIGNLHHLAFTYLFISIIIDVSINMNDKKSFFIILAITLFISHVIEGMPSQFMPCIKDVVLECEGNKENKVIDYLEKRDISQYHIIDVWSGYYSVYYDRYDKFYDLFLDGNLGQRKQIDVVKETIEKEKGNYFIIRTTKYDDTPINSLVSSNIKEAINYIVKQCEFECTINKNYAVYKIP